MISKGKDSAPVASNHKAAMSSYSTSTSASTSASTCTSTSTSTSASTSAPTSTSTSTTMLPAVQILNDRGEFSASLGVLPPAWRPIVRRCVPWFAKGDVAVKRLAGLAIAAVSKRLALAEAGAGSESGARAGTDRVDLLSKLQEGKDDEGRPMGREELTAEAQTQLIAGSDTTSKCVPFYSFPSFPLVFSIFPLVFSLSFHSFRFCDGVFVNDRTHVLYFLAPHAQSRTTSHATPPSNPSSKPNSISPSLPPHLRPRRRHKTR